MNPSNVMNAVRTELKDNLPGIGASGDSLDITNVVSQVRLNIADTVEPYRWGDALVYQYVKDTIKDLIASRSDLDGVTITDGTAPAFTTTMPSRFHQAVVAGAAYKCFSNDAEDSQDTERRTYFEKEYLTYLNGVKYHYSDAMILGYITDGVTEITQRRPDVLLQSYGSDVVALPDYLKQSIVDYVVSRCLNVTMQDNMDVKKQQLYYYERYMTETYGGKSK